MSVLVASASKHGGTDEIAKTIGKVLEAQGVQVEVKRVQEVDTAMPYALSAPRRRSRVTGGWLISPRPSSS
jgi:menaquinone-dependent protoporphyrinogen IX oxidase